MGGFIIQPFPQSFITVVARKDQKGCWPREGLGRASVSGVGISGGGKREKKNSKTNKHKKVLWIHRAVEIVGNTELY